MKCAYDLGSSVCSSRFVQDRTNAAEVDGREFGKWKGSYSCLPVEAQTNDPSKPPFSTQRLKSTHNPNYFSRLYVVFGRSREGDDETYDKLTSETDRHYHLLKIESDVSKYKIKSVQSPELLL